MTFRLVIFTALVAIARAGFISNGGHPVVPAIGGPYVSNGGLFRGETSGYGYPGRNFPAGVSGVSSSLVAVRPGYGSPYPYGGRNLPVGIPSYQSISGYGGRPLSNYPSASYSSYSSSPILKSNGYLSGGFPNGFNGGYNNGYSSSNLQHYGHQPIAFTASPIPHNPHGNFNGLGNGYGY